MKLLIFLPLLLIGCLKTRSQLDREEKVVREKQIEVANQNNQQSEILEQLRSYNGRLESIEQKLSRDENREQEENKARTDKQNEINEKFKVIEEALSALEKNLLSLNEEVAEIKKDRATASTKGGSSEQFEQAEKLFYKKEWSKAILAYQQYREKQPKGKNYDHATYKMGVCFEEMNKKSEAKAFFEEVIAKFPNSQFAKKAQYRLRKKN